MYHASNYARSDDKIEHARFIEELLKEKKSLEKKYSILVGDVNKFADETEKRVVHQHYYKIIAEGRQEGEMEAVEQELCKSSRKRRKLGRSKNKL
jgi:hypothetical protein